MTVRTIKTSGGDYSTIAAWEADTDNDLVTQQVTEEGELYGTTWAENTTIAGATTNTTYYRALRAAAGERHDGTAAGGGVVIDPSASGHAFTVSEAQFRLEWLRITGVAGSSDEGVRYSSGDGLRVSYCIFHDLNAVDSHDGIFVGDFGSTNTVTCRVKNCIFYDCDRSGIHVQDSANKTVYVHNCTFDECGTTSNQSGITDTGWSNSASSVVHCANVTCTNIPTTSSTGYSAEQMTINVRYCATDQNSITGDGATNLGNNVTNTSRNAEFLVVTEGSENFHLKSTSPKLKDAGVDLTSDANLPVTDDIDGQSRSAPFDIGADEEGVAAPPAGHPSRKRLAGVEHSHAHRNLAGVW